MTSTESENKYYSQYTNYPGIFKDAYWGNFRFNINDEVSYRESFMELCSNRNKFVEENCIEKLIIKPTRKIRERVLDELYPWCRHIEYYKCRDNKIIVIFSKFVKNDREHNTYLNKGYKLIPHLYADDQNTYMKFYS